MSDPHTTMLLAIVGALTSAIAVIGLLVKAVIEGRRQRNGQGHVTREQLTAQVADLKAHIDVTAGHLDKQIDEIKGGFAAFRKVQHDRWDALAPVIGVVPLLERRIDRLEDRRP